MHLDGGVQLSHVPHVHTVVIIHTAEPAADRVVGNGDGVWVAGVLVERKQVADGRGEKYVNLYCLKIEE